MPQNRRYFLLSVFTLGLTVWLTSCGTQTIAQYKATAKTTLTWRVKYTSDPMNDRQATWEEFSSTSLTNVNGERPAEAFGQADDKGLWWPKIPDKPSLDRIEERQTKAYQKPGTPELLRTVNYYITYQQDGQTMTLPTNYAVYRQVVKAYPQQIPLRLTMGINNGSVEKAEPINN